MDKNTFTGLFLMLVIIVVSFFLMKPSEEDIKREQQLQDSIAAAQHQPADVQQETTQLADTSTAAPAIDSTLLSGPFGASRQGNDQVITLENELIKVNIQSKGGRIESVELKGEKTFQGEPLLLFEGQENAFGLLFTAAGVNINTNDLYFQNMENESTPGQVIMRLNYAEGRYIDYVYQLEPESYQVGFTILTQGMQQVVAPTQKSLVLNWQAALGKKEQDLSSEQRYSTAYYQTAEDGVDHLSTSKDDSEKLGKTNWISFKQHFFSNVLISESGFDAVELAVETSADPQIVKAFSAQLSLPFDQQQTQKYAMQFFFGPNKFDVLKAQGHKLEEQVDLGWGPMTWINRFITLPVFNVLEGFHWGYGLIILVLTVLLKLVLSPLTYKSYVSMAKMRVLKPEMDAIKEKVGTDNQTLLQQEYMKLYKQAGVNPMGGCIPMLLQMPFTIAFFFFFPNLFELRGESFLWMHDLSTYDAVVRFKPIFGIGHLSLMTLLMTGATLLSTWYNNSVSGATGQMKYIGYFMPLIFLFVLNSYPSGLTYYYFLSTVFTFGLQFFIRQRINDEKIHAIIQENKKKPESKKKSGFQKRMEDYMRQQQQQQAQRKK